MNRTLARQPSCLTDATPVQAFIIVDLELQILSDLHLESPAAYDTFKIDPKAPYLALLGDIGCVKDAGFFDFLRRQLQVFKVVFLVLGNHEPYNHSLTDTISDVNSFAAECEASYKRGETQGQFILLNRTRFDISPFVTILGCPLFSYVTDTQMDHVSFGLNDF